MQSRYIHNSAYTHTQAHRVSLLPSLVANAPLESALCTARPRTPKMRLPVRLSPVFFPLRAEQLSDSSFRFVCVSAAQCPPGEAKGITGGERERERGRSRAQRQSLTPSPFSPSLPLFFSLLSSFVFRRTAGALFERCGSVEAHPSRRCRLLCHTHTQTHIPSPLLSLFVCFLSLSLCPLFLSLCLSFYPSSTAHSLFFAFLFLSALSRTVHPFFLPLLSFFFFFFFFSLSLSLSPLLSLLPSLTHAFAMYALLLCAALVASCASQEHHRLRPHLTEYETLSSDDVLKVPPLSLSLPSFSLSFSPTHTLSPLSARGSAQKRHHTDASASIAPRTKTLWSSPPSDIPVKRLLRRSLSPSLLFVPLHYTAERKTLKAQLQRLSLHPSISATLSLPGVRLSPALIPPHPLSPVQLSWGGRAARPESRWTPPACRSQRTGGRAALIPPARPPPAARPRPPASPVKSTTPFFLFLPHARTRNLTLDLRVDRKLFTGLPQVCGASPRRRSGASPTPVRDDGKFIRRPCPTLGCRCRRRRAAPEGLGRPPHALRRSVAGTRSVQARGRRGTPPCSLLSPSPQASSSGTESLACACRSKKGGPLW